MVLRSLTISDCDKIPAPCFIGHERKRTAFAIASDREQRHTARRSFRSGGQKSFAPRGSDLVDSSQTGHFLPRFLIAFGIRQHPRYGMGSSRGSQNWMHRGRALINSFSVKLHRQHFLQCAFVVASGIEGARAAEHRETAAVANKV